MLRKKLFPVGLSIFTVFCRLLFRFSDLFGPHSQPFLRGVRKFCCTKLFSTGNYDSFKRNYPTTSYAPDGEDVIAYKFLHSVCNGFYVDVGAAHPLKNSVTRFFYDRGWSGINIDPRAEVMDMYPHLRPRDRNYCIAVSESEQEYSFWQAKGLSTFDESTVQRIGKEKFRKTTAKTRRLDSILCEEQVGEIHFLKIDVETFEKNVLLGIDFTRFRPWLLIIESTLPNTMTWCYDEWEDIITGHGYVFLTSYSVNRYYCTKEKYDLLRENFLALPLLPYLKKTHWNVLDRLCP